MQICCKLIAFGLAAIALSAARGGVPTEWQVRIGPKATVYQAERYHGDALDLRATLTSGGLPLVYQGAARLYAQTNGMGARWWDLAPVTVASNVLAATWLPEFDTGADVVDVFLGAPSNYQAHARIRFLPSPGPAPNSLPMPTPVLDFAAVDLVNVAALTNGWSFGSSADLTDATNYTNQVAEEFEDGQRVASYAYNADTASFAYETDSINGDEGPMYQLDLLVASTNAAIAVADAKISTNNAAFVAAVLAAPLAGASASDIAEIAEYGGYGTVGAALLALIAGLAALKRLVAGKADAADLRYALYAAQERWTWADGEDHGQPVYYAEDPSTEEEQFDWHGAGWYLGDQYDVSAGADATSLSNFEFPVGEGEDEHLERVTATRGYALHDRAVNLVTAPSGVASVSMVFPPAVAGRARDFLVRLVVTGETVPEVTFLEPDGTAVAFDADDDSWADIEQGVNLLMFTDTNGGAA